MNCTTCRYELSQCLDGRLPSGRRGLVMQHVEDCDDCGTFWSELQAAQKLVLQLPRERVGDGFRDQLFERIRSGEGTPEAVFREPVPTLAKVRYAFTGAAAAAAVLVLATWFRDGRPSPVENHVVTPGHVATPHVTRQEIRGAETASLEGLGHLYENPLIAATQRLTTDVVALEAARQMEQRYDSAHRALRRLEARDASDREATVQRLLEDTDEFLVFGELLLDMRDRKRLLFTEPGIDADLTVAVRLLGQAGQRQRNLETVREMVAPALQSTRLGNISSAISLVPLDPREERDVLVRLNSQRPEVFPKLFIVFGTPNEPPELSVFGDGAFVLDDPCGPSWVAPRSMVEAGDGRLRLLRTRIQVQQSR
jgi:hypothetical protein